MGKQLIKNTKIGKTRFLFISLSVRDGEREHTHKILHSTRCKDINFAAHWYAAHYWGESYLEVGNWYAWNGEIAISVKSVNVLTTNEYKVIKKFI